MSYKLLIHWLMIMEEDIRTNPKLKPLPVPTNPDGTPNIDVLDTRNVTEDYSIHMAEVYKKELKHFFAVLRKLTLKDKFDKGPPANSLSMREKKKT